MNVGLDKLTPGVFFVSHGGGTAGEIIRHATGSWAGHAGLYLGGGQIVQGQPPVAALAPADSHDDAIWAWRMWDQLQAELKLPDSQVRYMQDEVVQRGHALVGCSYDFEAYAAFALMVMKLRTAGQLSPLFRRDAWRVCSALVYDAETSGKVPMEFVPEDGPGLVAHPDARAVMPPNLVAPGMLLGIAQRREWT